MRSTSARALRRSSTCSLKRVSPNSVTVPTKPKALNGDGITGSVEMNSYKQVGGAPAIAC